MGSIIDKLIPEEKSYTVLCAKCNIDPARYRCQMKFDPPIHYQAQMGGGEIIHKVANPNLCKALILLRSYSHRASIPSDYEIVQFVSCKTCLLPEVFNYFTECEKWKETVSGFKLYNGARGLN